jgi:hypothetical protein
MLLVHPLTSKAHHHDKHPHPKPFAKRMKKKTKTKKDTQDFNVINQGTKISWEGEFKRQAKRSLNQALMKLINQRHKIQLGNKMIISIRNHMGRAKDMGVMINQGREETQGENA